MIRTRTRRLRSAWLEIHKWIGLLLGLVIVPISLTGAVLVWHEDLDLAFHPQRTVFGQEGSLREPDFYVVSTTPLLRPGERIVSMRYPGGQESALIVTTTLRPTADGRPVRNTLWLDPRSGKVLDWAMSGSGLLQVLHRIHGSLMVQNGWGRPIVGWVGVFMLLSCLTGIWLWWPFKGTALGAFRWHRRNSTSANLHHLFGFWMLLPLAMLSFTGVWISFPSLFGKLEAKSAGRGSQADRMRTLRALPLSTTHLTAGQALRASDRFARGSVVSLTWPTDRANSWKIAYAFDGRLFEVAIDDDTGAATAARTPAGETKARLMRRLHDGSDMGAAWKILISLAGIIPALLAITGIIMWVRNRARRGSSKQVRVTLGLDRQTVR